MISVSVWRKTLVRLGACGDGLALFDKIASLQDENDGRRLKRIRVKNWTPLCTVWLHSNHSSFARWCEDQNLIPRANLARANLVGAYLARANLARANLARANLARANLDGANLDGAYLARANLARANLARANLDGANLDGANLDGAYRGSSSKVPGWRTLATGYLEREDAEVAHVAV